MEDFDKKISNREEGSVLAKLFRKIIMDLGINSNKFNQLVSSYVNRVNRKNSNATKLTYKSHIISKLKKDTLTWKVFITGLFGILNVREVKFIVVLKHDKGDKTTHEITITNANYVKFKEKKNE